MVIWTRIKEFKVFGIVWWYFLYPLKWGAFLRGTYNKDNVPFEFCEIVIYRSLQCPDCMDNGSCLQCGCSVPESMMDLSNWCKGGNWDKITPEMWIEYKNRTGLKFRIEYGE